MQLTQYKPTDSLQSFDHPAISCIDAANLKRTVHQLNYPRHFIDNLNNNRKARDYIVNELSSYGLKCQLQGTYDNVIATTAGQANDPHILLGAHYDTVPTTPGADDNSSAIAVCLEAARVISLHSTAKVTVAIFNREEDGLLGSQEFVQSLTDRHYIKEAHIFEMVGYFSDLPGSQSKPSSLPIPIPNTGDFIAVVSNSRSNKIADKLRSISQDLASPLPMISLKTYFGIERLVSDLLRSDHTPFWKANIPAVMWTDTSEFRNPNYHAPTDTPETLDYDLMAEITKVISSHVIQSAP